MPRKRNTSGFIQRQRTTPLATGAGYLVGVRPADVLWPSAMRVAEQRRARLVNKGDALALYRFEKALRERAIEVQCSSRKAPR